MLTPENQTSLPDVAVEKPKTLSGPLDWVGMKSIEAPILLQIDGKLIHTPALLDAFVSLDATDARGIHMSRLFKEAQETLAQTPIAPKTLKKILEQFLVTHEGLSNRAKISVRFSGLIPRAALKSENVGWRTYPIELSAELDRGGRPQFFVETVVKYSSTCPASAALSRQLIQENFKNSFRNQELEFLNVYTWLGTSEGVNATPHAQRSEAKVKIEVAVDSNFDFSDLVDIVEDALQTPVQTMVKRVDEQEFALRNGQNLMFCEDAARRVKEALLKHPEVLDFAAELKHMESLHPHDAVSTVSAGRALRF